ncbi:hypothetical protein Dimus_030171, partial [Dionaea muscipula]
KQAPSTGSSNYVWKPRTHKRNTTWQRILVQTKKSSAPISEQAVPIPITQPLASTESDPELPGISLPPDPTFTECQDSANCSLDQNSNLNQELPCSDKANTEQHGIDRDGFKKVIKRSRKKSTGFHANPEHHKDKSGDKPSR